ncbi:MAG TPA: hypothetical protein VM869_22180 [Enhygromyxa sp.]|nr:hypothetical protein [Enhygromyxa sp.]
MSGALDPRRVQQALVCMLFDRQYAERVRGDEPLPELRERERELLRELDPRALETDDMRRARALHVILDEYPVSAALLGIDAVDRFFSSPEFRVSVFERGSMALAFGERWLGERTAGIGVIETALARARRELRSASRESTSTIGRAPGVIPLRTPEKTLAWYRRARERLGADPLRTLLGLRKPWPQKPPRSGAEHLLIEPQADGSLGIAGASQGLVELLRAAEHPRPRAELVSVAIELGAEPHEAEALLQDLLREGLLRERGP